MPETNEGILILVGAVFFLIGLLGGGFEISALKIPSVGRWGRVISGGIGLILIGIALSRILIPPLPAQPATADPDTATQPPTVAAMAPTKTPIPPAPTVAPATNTTVASTTTATPGLSATRTPVPTDTPVAAPEGEPTEAQAISPGVWQQISDLPRHINALLVDPDDPSVFYAATGDASGSGSGVHRSEDAGLTWQVADDGLPNEPVTALAMGPREGATLFATVGVRGDLFATTDGAATWSLLGDTQLFGGYERLLRIDPNNPDVLYAAARSNALVRCQDGGRAWQPIGEGLPGDENATFILSLAIDPSDSSIVYAGTGGFVGGGHGVYRSSDGGDTWSASNRGMLDYRITALAVDPTDTQTVYAGSDDGELFRSTDSGQTWTELTEDLPTQMSHHPTIQDIIHHPAAPDTVYLLVEDAGVVVSGDEGNTWRLLGEPGQLDYTAFTAMAISFDGQPVIVVGVEREGGWRYAVP